MKHFILQFSYFVSLHFLMILSLSLQESILYITKYN